MDCSEGMEIISKPNTTRSEFRCERCRGSRLLIEQAQEMSAKAVMAALADLNERLAVVEAILRDEEEGH